VRYRLGVRAEPDIRSTPDIVFRVPKVAVYIDGCFWHGCPEHFISPKNNAAWWQEKIDANKRRDERVRHALAERGWTILSFWEHESPPDVAAKVLAALPRRKRPIRG
jgi:DNA mismatch endonuclease (patch repair protein)